MRRRIVVLVAMAVMALAMLAFSAPVFAEAGGAPHDPSCGLGTGAHVAIANETRPGASEISQPEARPVGGEFECPPPFQDDSG
jgi:hypothetical protein